MVLHNRLVVLISTASLALVLVANFVWAQESNSSLPDLASLSSSPVPLSDWQHNSLDPGAFYGSEILIVDIDGDSDEDVIVTAPLEDDGILGADVGAVYIYENDLGNVSNVPLQILRGRQSGERFGEGLVSGYFDSDSFVDLAIGAPGHISSATGTELGAIYILYGSGSATPFLQPVDPDLYGQSPQSGFGTALAVVNDVSTGDTFDELIVGAPKHDSAGAVFVYINLLTGFPENPTFSLTSGVADARYGFSLSTADYNGDSIVNDLAIGAPSTVSGGGSQPGSAQVFSLIETGIDPNYVYTATLLASYTGANNGDLFGHDVELVAMNPISTSQADLLVGIPGYQIDGGQPGGAIAYFQNEDFDATSDIGAANTLIDADWVAEAKAPNGMFGYALTAVDFDNDSFMDVVGSAKLNSINHINEGAIFYYLSQGEPFPSSTSPNWLVVGNSANSYFGASLAAGDLTASIPLDARDVIVGASGQNGSGAAHIYFNRTGAPFSGTHQLETDSPVTRGSPVSMSLPANGGAHNVFIWESGDGEVFVTADEVSAAQYISHTYPLAGIYTPAVRIMNPSASDFVTSQVHVQDPLSPFNIATTSPTRLTKPTLLRIDLSSGSPVTIRVNLGDSGSEQIYPLATVPLLITNTYSLPGSYQVIITGENGIDLVTETVEIAVFKPAFVPKNSGGNFSLDFVNGKPAGSKVTVTIPANATNEDVEMRFVPRKDAGEFPDDNSGMLYFDLHALGATTAVQDGDTTFVTCNYLPIIAATSSSSSSSTTQTINPFAGSCAPIPQYEFLQPVKVTLSYPDSAIPNGVSETALVLKYFDETQQKWVDGATSCPIPSTYFRDPDNNYIEVEICHQSRWSWRPN